MLNLGINVCDIILRSFVVIDYLLFYLEMDYGLLRNDFVCLTSDSLTTSVTLTCCRSVHFQSGLLLNKMKCLACGSEYLEDGKRRDAEIGRQLKQWHRAEERVVKLLLLGE